MKEEARGVGQPPKYSSPELMQDDIDRYFDDCHKNYVWLHSDGKAGPPIDTITNDARPTVSGLAYLLDMSTETLRHYGNKDEYTATVKKAKLRIEMALEQHLYGTAVTGAIFNLKNNFGWKDKTEQELSGPNGGPIQTKTLSVVGVESDHKDS